MQSLHSFPPKIKAMPLIVVRSKYLVRFPLATLQCSNSPLHWQKCIVAVVMGLLKLVTILFNQQDWRKCSFKQRQKQTASVSLIAQMTNLTTRILRYQ